MVLRVLWLLVVLALSTAAHAGDDRERARELGREGLHLYEAGRWNEAYDKLRQADALHHAPTLVLFMARSRREAGKLLEAQELYRSLIEEKLAADAPEQFRSAKDDAHRELVALRERVPTLLLVLPEDEPSASATIDGRDHGSAPFTSPVPLDPGVHQVVARASDGRQARATVTLRERDRERVELSWDEVVPDTPRTTAPAEPRNEGTLVPAGILYGFAGAALAVGIATGVMTMTRADDLKSRCVDNHCPRADAELGEEAETLATVSTVGFAVAGAALVAAVVLTIVRPGADSSDGEVTARLGPGALSIGGTF